MPNKTLDPRRRHEILSYHADVIRHARSTNRLSGSIYDLDGNDDTNLIDGRGDGRGAGGEGAKPPPHECTLKGCVQVDDNIVTLVPFLVYECRASGVVHVCERAVNNCEIHPVVERDGRRDIHCCAISRMHLGELISLQSLETFGADIAMDYHVVEGGDLPELHMRTRTISHIKETRRRRVLEMIQALVPFLLDPMHPMRRAVTMARIQKRIDAAADETALYVRRGGRSLPDMLRMFLLARYARASPGGATPDEPPPLMEIEEWILGLWDRLDGPTTPAYLFVLGVLLIMRSGFANKNGVQIVPINMFNVASTLPDYSDIAAFMLCIPEIAKKNRRGITTAALKAVQGVLG